MNKVIIPQAMRVIIPPLTSQYLNLTKNSSLAAAIAYPDLVSVFAGTALNQTGQAVEIIFITMSIYLFLKFVHLICDEHLQCACRFGGEVDAAIYKMVARKSFATRMNTFLSLICFWLVYVTIDGVVSWAFINASFFGADKASCMSNPHGACWPFLQKFNQFLRQLS